jgi:hypothetical protein
VGSAVKQGSGKKPKVVSDRVLRALFVAGERGITTREIVDEVYADRVDGGPLHADVSVRIAIFHLRPRIAPFGATIVSEGGKGARHYLRTLRRA